MGLPKDLGHLLVFSSLQSLHFKHFPSIQDHNLLPWPLGLFGLSLLLFCRHLDLPEAGSLSPSCWYTRGWGIGRLSRQALFISYDPLFTREFGICYFGLFQVVVKLTTSPCASCSSQAAASSLEAESCDLDIHVLHTQLPTTCLHSCSITPVTPPKSNACLGDLIKHTHLLVVSFHVNKIMGKVCLPTFTHCSRDPQL